MLVSATRNTLFHSFFVCFCLFLFCFLLFLRLTRIQAYLSLGISCVDVLSSSVERCYNIEIHLQTKLVTKILMYIIMCNYTANFIMKSVCCDRVMMMWWLNFVFFVPLVSDYKIMHLRYLGPTLLLCQIRKQATLIPKLWPCVTGNLVSAHAVTVQLPKRYQVVA